MQNIYEHCPTFENDRYRIRFLRVDDQHDLFKVYSDEKAVPFFNSDNCHGDDFYYKTEERMKQAINFWFFAYQTRDFVRFTIVDKRKNEAIGTIELFNRQAQDYFTNCGLLRLDLRSDYEKEEEIEEILSLIIRPSLSLFSCDMIATKAIPQATQRIRALERMGFFSSTEKLIGHDGTVYSDYYVLNL